MYLTIYPSQAIFQVVEDTFTQSSLFQSVDFFPKFVELFGLFPYYFTFVVRVGGWGVVVFCVLLLLLLHLPQEFLFPGSVGVVKGFPGFLYLRDYFLFPGLVRLLKGISQLIALFVSCFDEVHVLVYGDISVVWGVAFDMYKPSL